MSKQKPQARRDKARRIKEADRRLINLSRERRELWQLERDAPLVKLDEPYQRGWIRYFALTEEVTRRKDAEQFQKLLKYVQFTQHSRHPQFMERKHWKSRRLRPSRHNLRSFSVSTLLWMKVSEDLLPYLMTEKRRPISTHARLRELLLSHYRGKLKVRHPHYFKRIVEPHMITHRRVALPNVERRLTEIDFILGQDSNYGRLHNLQCSRVPSWKYCPGKQNDTKDYRNAMKEAQSDLLEYHMDKQSITQERVVNPPSLSLSYILRLTQAGILRVDLLRPHCFSSGVMKFFFNFSIS